MSALKRVWRELAGLFVDDGSFAAAILVWLVCGAIAIRFDLDPAIAGVLLFGGLAALLVENVWRAAGRARKLD